MKQPPFVNGQFYHVYNRGVDKRKVFLREKDYLRFIHDLFEFNDQDAVMTFPQRVSSRRHLTLGGETSKSYRGPEPIMKRRKLLVDILAWALMPNHYHLLLRQRVENGISLFMKKLGTGYTLSFNLEHERNGVLFQGTFRAKQIDQDQYLRHLLMYIHANPVGLVFPEEGEEFNLGKSMRFLESYRWSSYFDYLGKKNYASLLNRAIIDDLALPLGNKHRDSMRQWLDDRRKNTVRLGEAAIDSE